MQDYIHPVTLLVLLIVISRVQSFSIHGPRSGMSCSKSHLANSQQSDDQSLQTLTFRSPTDIELTRCLEIETASYPEDEAATMESLKTRHSQANAYFQCALLEGQIVGFVCGTRCQEFTEESMSTHDPSGKFLAIHSVVVDSEYRRRGFASTMLKEYVDTICQDVSEDNDIASIVLIAKAHLLGFYVNCGFKVNRPSPIVHGKDQWYDLEKKLVRTSKRSDESWFCKTEQFSKPYPEVKPFLEEHKRWVTSLRQAGACLTSGYRVDSDGRPGGGGLMFLAAKSYDDAKAIVEQDPLIKNDCVKWELCGWFGQVGDIEMG